MVIKDFFKVGERTRWENIAVILVVFIMASFVGFVGFWAVGTVRGKVEDTVSQSKQESLNNQGHEIRYTLSEASWDDNDYTDIRNPCVHYGLFGDSECYGYILTGSAKKTLPQAIKKYREAYPDREIPSVKRMESFLRRPPYVYAIGARMEWPRGMKEFLIWLGKPADLKYTEPGTNPDGSMHWPGDSVPASRWDTNWMFLSYPSAYYGKEWR